MDGRAILHKFFYQYFLIFTGMMIAVLVYCKAFFPGVVFSAGDITAFMIQAFIADLPLLILYSPKELTRKQCALRRALHFLLLEGVLLGIGLYCHYIVSRGQIIAFVICVAAVYLFVCLGSYCVDMKTANELNRRIRERREEKQ